MASSNTTPNASARENGWKTEKGGALEEHFQNVIVKPPRQYHPIRDPAVGGRRALSPGVKFAAANDHDAFWRQFRRRINQHVKSLIGHQTPDRKDHGNAFGQLLDYASTAKNALIAGMRLSNADWHDMHLIFEPPQLRRRVRISLRRSNQNIGTAQHQPLQRPHQFTEPSMIDDIGMPVHDYLARHPCCYQRQGSQHNMLDMHPHDIEVAGASKEFTKILPTERLGGDHLPKRRPQHGRGAMIFCLNPADMAHAQHRHVATSANRALDNILDHALDSATIGMEILSQMQDP